MTPARNQLYFGDNLHVLCESIAAQTFKKAKRSEKDAKKAQPGFEF